MSASWSPHYLRVGNTVTSFVSTPGPASLGGEGGGREEEEEEEEGGQQQEDHLRTPGHGSSAPQASVISGQLKIIKAYTGTDTNGVLFSGASVEIQSH